MKSTLHIKISVVLLLLAFSTQLTPAQDSLPNYISIELKRLEETWHILDNVSTKIWPGWTKYADIPFLFTYPNGVKLLVGHPNPPEGFSAVAGLEVRGKKVYLDRRHEIPLAMPLPLNGGGGPQHFGMVEGKPVRVVSISSRPLPVPPGKNPTDNSAELYALGSENQILLLIHELFHCFQYANYQWKYGNLRFNTDENFATYAEIEGLALERAYLEPNNRLAREYLKDCHVAKQLKRMSMSVVERSQETEEDVMEGTATYADLMTSTLLKPGYTPILTQKEDPFFFGFRYIDSLVQQKLSMLRTTRVNTLSSVDKCYPNGCFQAMLLTRFSPTWRDGFFQKGAALEDVIDSLLSISPSEREHIANGLKSRYGYDTIFARHARVIKERNEAFEETQKRKGLTFVVNFKNTGEFVLPESTKTPYKVGLINIYPNGIKRIKIADVLFEGEETPMLSEQLYYVKWIDTAAKETEKSYSVEGDREGTTSVYRNAVFKSRGFKLAAPKIEIKETRNRVKITVLAKVKS